MKNNNISVCIVNPDYYRSSGVTIAIKRLHKAIINHGIDYTFVDCGCRDTEKDDYFDTSNYYLMKPWKLSFWTSLAKFLRFLKKTDIDILHVHHRRLLIILWPISKWTKIPLVYTGHLVYSSSFSKKFITYNNAIAITNSVKEDIQNEFSFKRIDVISNAIKFPEKKFTDKLKEKVIICVGRLDSVKNHKLLLEAWNLSKLQNNDWKLLLFGEGDLEIELKDLSKKLKISKSIEFKGFQENWIELAQNASFAVLPSFVEGQGLVTIESASIGIPSLVSNVPGSRDCIPKNHLLPNLFSPNNAKELANMLIIWSKDSNNLAREADLIFEYTRSFASSDIVAKQTSIVYKSILKGKNK